MALGAGSPRVVVSLAPAFVIQPLYVVPRSAMRPRGGHVDGASVCLTDAPILPDAEIVWERIAGVPKSMTAIKHCT